MALYRFTVTEHDGNVVTRIFLCDRDMPQVLRTRLQRELESQVTISELEPVADFDIRSQEERTRAVGFIMMVL
jgi:hypothetical protein